MLEDDAVIPSGLAVPLLAGQCALSIWPQPGYRPAARRRSINERLHLRLWLTPLRLKGKCVWVGQVSRDIGVRFTTKTWNLTTHRVDPDVDEARDYVIEDLLQAGRVRATGYVDGVGACDRASPRRNLTGDPYYTDGKRAVIVLSETRTTPQFVAWS